MAVSMAGFSTQVSSEAFSTISFIDMVFSGRFSMIHFNAWLKPFVWIVWGLQYAAQGKVRYQRLESSGLNKKVINDSVKNFLVHFFFQSSLII
jgi:hypothetical protein